MRLRICLAFGFGLRGLFVCLFFDAFVSCLLLSNLFGVFVGFGS